MNSVKRHAIFPSNKTLNGGKTIVTALRSEGKV